MLKNLGIGEFLPSRILAPPVSSLCVNYPLDEQCAQVIAYIFYGPSAFITPDDYSE